jgi:hypothetical protein
MVAADRLFEDPDAEGARSDHHLRCGCDDPPWCGDGQPCDSLQDVATFRGCSGWFGQLINGTSSGVLTRLSRPRKCPPGRLMLSHDARNRKNWRMIGTVRREVGAELEVEITEATTLEFQIAVAPHPCTEVFESLRFVLNGRPIQPLEVSGEHGNRIHKFDAERAH